MRDVRRWKISCYSFEIATSSGQSSRAFKSLAAITSVIAVPMVAIGSLIDNVMVTSSSVSFQCAVLIPGSAVT
jgi:hypothetical protein